MNTSRRNLWLGCGALLVVGLCVGGLLALAGVGGIAAIFGPDPEGLTVEVAVVPGLLAQGDEFQLHVTAGNDGSRPLTVSQINLPHTLLDAARLKDVTPVYQERTRLSQSTGFTFAQDLQPGQRQKFIFIFESLRAGDFDGDLEVLVGVRRKLVPMRVVVGPEPTSAPVVLDVVPSTQANVPFQAVVQITALFEENGELFEGWTGSGSIVTPDGLILTNAHVVLPDKNFPVDALAVALTVAEDRPPVPTYFAEVVQADEALDIAVIRIISDLDGVAVNPDELNLTVVPMGNSNDLRLGDPMVILGYPGIGGDTITLTSGEVSGFTAETGRGERAFIKTSATIAGGNSGGLAADENGQLIGVPTQLGYGGDGQFIDCRVLADTNRDGIIDDLDTCVPTGGFINALRPLELALPLIEAARRGEVAVHTDEVLGPDVSVEGTVIYADDFSDESSGWDVVSEADYSVGYRNGAYEIELQADRTFVWSIAGQDFSDVVVSADAQVVRPTGEGDFGVICRYQDGDNYYGLEVSEDGYFTIWKREGGEFFPLLDWQSSDILQPDGSAVSLSAACTGSVLQLAVNGIVLAEVQDSTFFRGDVGVIAGTWDTVGLVIAFDNFIVRAP